MKKYLLIAEKPSLMKSLKETYFKHKDEIGLDIDFIALAGHVYGLKEVKEYKDWEDVKWADLELPCIPKKFETKAINSKIIKQLKEKLKSNSYDGIIAAEDADREGNYIHLLIEMNIDMSSYETLRIWLNEGLTDKLILKAYKNMVDFHADEAQTNLSLAAILRGRRDWLIGMNFTIASTLKLDTLTKVGTVKAPTLKLVYDNCKAIDEFVPSSTFELHTAYEGFEAKSKLVDSESHNIFKFESSEDAYNFLNDDLELASPHTVESIEKTEESKKAPKLYKLSSLQVDMGKAYGYSPEKTLELAQSLYEKHKLVSYPRTDCEYLTSDMVKDFSSMLNSLKGISEFESAIDSISDTKVTSSKYINNKKISESSHTALVPTGLTADLSKLTADEVNVFKAISKRFIAMFLPDNVNIKTEILLKTDNGYFFKLSGKVTKEAGFTEFLGIKSTDSELPELKEGDVLNVDEYEVAEVVKTPPARLTEATLISAMENISKTEDCEAFKETGGLGTPATRGTIINDLLKGKYFETKGKTKAIYITDKGKKIIEALSDFDFINPVKIAELETDVLDVSKGSKSFVDAYEEVVEYVSKTTEDIMSANLEKIEDNKVSRQTGLECPACGAALVNTKAGIGCSAYKDGCKFFIGNKICGKSLSDAQKYELIEKGKTGLLKGFTSKAGKKFDARLVLGNDGKISFKFD